MIENPDFAIQTDTSQQKADTIINEASQEKAYITTNEQTFFSIEQAAEADAEDCTHHWKIESPNGPTSPGICRDCGEEKNFRNSLPNVEWENIPI